MPRNASDRVSEKLDFENFPGEHTPGTPQRCKKFRLAASRLAKIFRNLSGLPSLQNHATALSEQIQLWKHFGLHEEN